MVIAGLPVQNPAYNYPFLKASSFFEEAFSFYRDFISSSERPDLFIMIGNGTLSSRQHSISASVIISVTPLRSSLMIPHECGFFHRLFQISCH